MARKTVKASTGGLYQPDDRSRERDVVLHTEFNKLVAEVAELKTALAEHVHDGVTTGSDKTDEPDEITYSSPEADFVDT